MADAGEATGETTEGKPILLHTIKSLVLRVLPRVFRHIPKSVLHPSFDPFKIHFSYTLMSKILRSGQMFSLEYRRIGASQDELLGEAQDGNEKGWRDSRNSKSLPWICSTICLFFLLGAQSLYYAGFRRCGTYETGFATEFGELSV